MRFTPLQSEKGQALLKEFHLQTDVLSSVVFIDEGKISLQSGAALSICKYLDGAWKLLYVFILIPKPIRDAIYNWVGRNRYRWFGKTEACMLPTEDLRSRFL